MSEKPRTEIPHTATGTPIATQSDALIADLLGYAHYRGVAFTRDQASCLARVYGFDIEIEPAGNSLMAAGNRRNLMRLVERDGLRTMGLLSRYLESGEDPVRLVATALASLGYDVEADEDAEVIR